MRKQLARWKTMFTAADGQEPSSHRDRRQHTPMGGLKAADDPKQRRLPAGRAEQGEELAALESERNVMQRVTSFPYRCVTFSKRRGRCDQAFQISEGGRIPRLEPPSLGSKSQEKGPPQVNEIGSNEVEIN